MLGGTARQESYLGCLHFFRQPLSNTSLLDVPVVRTGAPIGEDLLGLGLFGRGFSGPLEGAFICIWGCGLLLLALWETLLYDCRMAAITVAGAVVVSGDELTHLGESS